MKIQLDRSKIDICLAKKKMSVANLAKEYGVSRARINVILNQREVTPIAAGRLADALGVDVIELI